MPGLVALLVSKLTTSEQPPGEPDLHNTVQYLMHEKPFQTEHINRVSAGSLRKHDMKQSYSPLSEFLSAQCRLQIQGLPHG